MQKTKPDICGQIYTPIRQDSMSISNESKIIRELPRINDRHNYVFRQIINEKKYPYRLTQADFDKCDNIVKDPNYIKLLNGINYKTKRAIKIKGDTYCNVLKEFTIANHTPEEIMAINREEYFEKSKLIISEIDEYNKKYKHIIDKYNEAMRQKIYDCEKYNIECLEAIEQIKKLTTWDSYVELYGLKYGIPEIYENIHRKNDCMGVFEYSDIVVCDCFMCIHSGCCSNPIRQLFKCSVCGFPKEMNTPYMAT